MATITYNGIGSPSNMVTLTDIPNILKVSDSQGGTMAELDITVISSMVGITSADTQWYITFLGETITNVLDSNNAINKNFHISSNNQSTAASMARAFRNCPTIAANFNVELTSNGSLRIIARNVGNLWEGMQNYYSTNITSSYMNSTVTQGQAYSSLNGALIDVDVYSNGNYITTLEKSWYDGEAAFNVSPVLTTISSVGKTVPYDLRISSFKNGEYALLGNINGVNSSVGYMCNQGSRYIIINGVNIAQNVSRGANRAQYNNMLLYVYHNSIPLSFYSNTSSGSLTITYLDSAYNTLATQSDSWGIASGNKLGYKLIDLTSSSFSDAFYIDVTIDGKTLRYNVIKPLKATEYSQRLLWRNSYGGVSFFDFTGAKTETRDLEVMTYQKNIFGYYDDSKNELEKVYDNDVKYTVTLKSHLFENDGKYIFNDLIQSSDVWTEVNGVTYGVIIDSVSVDETDNNNIYEATVKYHYSQEPSLI